MKRILVPLDRSATAEQVLGVEAEASAYLGSLAATHLAGVPVDGVVRFGRVMHQIRRELDAFEADTLCVMTKTRSSLTRALLGSVAEELLHEAPVTVVLVRPAP